MKGDRNVIQALNKNLGLLLVSINQYFLHARILKNQGIEAIGKVCYKQSIREMKSADALIERILLLEGLPNLQEYGKILIGEHVEEILACDVKSEEVKHQALLEAIQTAESAGDYVTRQLLEGQKNENEEYLDWLETQQDLINELGVQNYLQHVVSH